MSHEVLKDWVTKAGLRAVVIRHPAGHHCGYVAVPEGRPLYDTDYADVNVEVHGGLTFSEGSIVGLPKQIEAAEKMLELSKKTGLLRSFFQAELDYLKGHAGEQSNYPVPSDTPVWWFGYDCAHYGDRFRNCDLEFCTQECEQLAKQLTK